MVFLKNLQEYSHYGFALIIILALPLGHFFPSMSQLNIENPYILAIMLYPMMINLYIEEIFKILPNFRLVLVCVTVNFIIIPLWGAIWAYFLFENTNPYLAVGFILNFTIPCSEIVMVRGGYAKGRFESFRFIAALNFVLSIFMVPTMMWLLADNFILIHPIVFINKIFTVLALPFLAGIITRHLILQQISQKRFAKKTSPIISNISTGGVLVIIFFIVSSRADIIVANYKDVFITMVGISTLYPVIMLLKLFFSKFACDDYGDGMALICNGAVKNPILIIVFATTVFGGTLVVLPAVIAPALQIPLMLCMPKLSKLIMRFLQESND